MPEIISRHDAMTRGLPRYFTGQACKRGHVAERMTRNADCLGCLATRYEKPKKRTDEQNRRRNELAAQRMRETLGADDASSVNRRAFAGLGHLMQSAEAQERSRYLDAMIKNGANYNRRDHHDA